MEINDHSLANQRELCSRDSPYCTPGTILGAGCASSSVLPRQNGCWLWEHPHRARRRWHCPDDLSHFRGTTFAPVLLGSCSPSTSSLNPGAERARTEVSGQHAVPSRSRARVPRGGGSRVPPPGHPHAQGSRQKAGARGTGQSRGRWLGMAVGGWDRLRRRSHGDPMERRARQPRFPCTFPAAGTLVGVGAPSSRQKTLADPTARVKRCWRSPPFRLAGDSLFFALQLKQAVTSRKNSCRIALRFVRHPPPATSCQAHANPEPPFGTIKINAGSEKSRKSVLFCEALIT